MLELTPEEEVLVLGRLPKELRTAPKTSGRRKGIKNYDMATRVMFGIRGTMNGVTKTAREGAEVESLDSGDMIPVIPSLPTVANARDGKIGNRLDSNLKSQVGEGLDRIEEIGVERLEQCLSLVSEADLEDMSARDRVGMGVHIATIIEKIGKRTGDRRSGGVTMNFYTPERQKNVTDYGKVIPVERGENE